MTHVQSLTDRALRALTKPKPAAVAIFDTEVKQLQVRANASGTAVSFSVLKRPPGSLCYSASDVRICVWDGNATSGAAVRR